MNKKKAEPTMADVAREAGVALGTVSRVINGQQVGTEFREKVEAAIRRLGYQYNSSGRAFRRNSSNIIAVIMPSTINPYFALLVHHLNRELEKRDKRMLLYFTEYDRNREQDFIRMAQENRVDGIIALTYNPDLVIPEDIPFVTIDRFFSDSVPCVASDNFSGGYLAAQKLHELGCAHVAVMRVASHLINEPSKRKDGFVSGCVELGMAFDSKIIDDETPFSAFEDYLREHLHNGRLDFDGLFIGTDLQAYKIIKALKKMQIRVPEDVQVIGFDGIRMFGDMEYVVSTIVQPVPEIAEACVSTVLSKHLSAMPSLICLPVHYASGGTTKD